MRCMILTEGGVVAALNEMATASNVGFRVYWSNFLFPKEAQVLKNEYRLSDVQLYLCLGLVWFWSLYGLIQ